MSDVFISYARSTQTQAELVEAALTSAGYSVWRDEELPFHRPYPEVIEEHLRTARAVVVLWSREALASDWVRSEADHARQQQKLVQVSVDETRPPMPFDQIQCGDLTGWEGDTGSPAWRKLVASLSQLASAKTPASAPARGTTGPLLAVLAFDNLSKDTDMLYFSDGVSEEILQTVSQTTGLRVIGRSSSFQFRGPEKAARHVAAELGCTHVLDGSVRRGGDRVRIAASLIECAGQTSLWSDRFDRDLSDVFALQDEIAAAVAAALKSAFAPSASVGPIDPAAYDLYLRARTSTPGILGAFDAALLKQATALAPNFAKAWSALAVTRALQAIGDRSQPFEPARAEAQSAADKALALDPMSGAAYAALALLVPICGRFQEAEALFEKALATSPDDPDALEKYSRWLHCVGRSEDAFARISHAYEIDPLYHQGANWYAVFLAVKRRAAEAFEVWDKARARWPHFDILTLNPINTAAANKDWDRVDALITEAQTLGLDSPRLRDAIKSARTLRYRSAESKAELVGRLNAQISETGTVSLNGFVRACELGLHVDAYDLAARASFDHLFRPGGRLPPEDYGLHVLFNARPGMALDRRFVGLCAKLGLCDYWVSSGHWPDAADDEAAPYDFKAECRRLASTMGRN
jgi:TolB-like protein/Tfp pilus assembly protein PilF